MTRRKWLPEAFYDAEIQVEPMFRPEDFLSGYGNDTCILAPGVPRGYLRQGDAVDFLWCIDLGFRRLNASRTPATLDPELPPIEGAEFAIFLQSDAMLRASTVEHMADIVRRGRLGVSRVGSASRVTVMVQAWSREPVRYHLCGRRFLIKTSDNA